MVVSALSVEFVLVLCWGSSLVRHGFVVEIAVVAVVHGAVVEDPSYVAAVVVADPHRQSCASCVLSLALLGDPWCG